MEKEQNDTPKGFAGIIRLVSGIDANAKSRRIYPPQTSAQGQALPNDGLPKSTVRIADQPESEDLGCMFYVSMVVICLSILFCIGRCTDSTPDTPKSSPLSHENVELVYTKPAPGTNNVLSVDEIHWCVREEIRLNAMERTIRTNQGADSFNQLVGDYNCRCGSYRYRAGDLERAKRDVEPFHTQIEADALHEASSMNGNTTPVPPVGNYNSSNSPY